jgi:hypothetical protein
MLISVGCDPFDKACAENNPQLLSLLYELLTVSCQTSDPSWEYTVLQYSYNGQLTKRYDWLLWNAVLTVKLVNDRV